MSKRLHDVVRFRGDRLFNGAVSIDWFSTDEERSSSAAEAFVFHGPEYHGVSQADVGTAHGHRLQDTAGFARSVIRRCYGLEDESFTLAIAGYGTGKSHLGLTLAMLLSNPEGQVAQAVLSSIEVADREACGEIRAILHEEKQPCLVVALNGMQDVDLTAEMTRQIMRDVRRRGLDVRPLDALRPRFRTALSVIGALNDSLAGELLERCELKSVRDVQAKLEQHDEYVYKQVHAFLAENGIPISALEGESLKDVIDVTVREYCGKGKPYRSLVVLFDEFGRYTEFATVRSQIAGSGVLQHLFEAIQANARAACFVGFIQFELNAYVQRVAPEYRNEILRYVSRYQAAKRVYLSINLETLIAHLLEKLNPKELSRWFDGPERRKESAASVTELQRWFPQALNHRLWCDAEQFHAVISRGCWPLSPYSTWLLYYLAAAGKHLQERSALALLGNAFERFSDIKIPDDGGWLIAPSDLWSDELQQELIVSEEGGQQGSVTHAYSSVIARHGARLGQDLTLILRAVVLASKMGLQAGGHADAVKALSQLSGVPHSEAEEGVHLLQDEYNVLGWDEAFKAFDILGDAVPRSQFLLFVRQRVASTYDEGGKAKLFVSRAMERCNLLADQECDFAEQKKITTREWRYRGVTASPDLLPVQIKLAAEQWAGATAVDEPRGTVIYCYVEPSRDPKAVAADTQKLLRNAGRATGAPALPILVLLLCDEEGELGQALAEFEVLDQPLSEQERLRFGNLIAAHKEKMLQTICSQVEGMIKKRLYVTCLAEEIEPGRLAQVGSNLFGKIYKTPLPFPFDGFSTARGNAADTCQALTTDLMQGKLDFDAIIAKVAKAKNRAVTVLKDAWGAFTRTGSISRRPSNPVARSITEEWDSTLATGERRLQVGQVLHELCLPPYGANIASAGLLLGVFIAPRLKKLVAVRDGQQYAVSKWVQDGVFRGKFLDLAALQNVDLILLGEESSQWESLLDEWEHSESHSERSKCLARADELKGKIPVPPDLAYKEEHLRKLGEDSIIALTKMREDKSKASDRLKLGDERADVSYLSWGCKLLNDLTRRMTSEKPLWTDYEIDELLPAMERARQMIIQVFPGWLPCQLPRTDSPEVVGDFKHKMLKLLGTNLTELGLYEQCDKLEQHVHSVIQKAETAAEARQLVRDVRSWLQAHLDSPRVGRVVELRALREVGNGYSAKLKEMSERMEMLDLAEVRNAVAQFLAKLRDTEEMVDKRADKLWNATLRSDEDLDNLLSEVEAMISAFDGCPNDVEDFRAMRAALKLYQDDFRRLASEVLSWEEFESLTVALREEAKRAFPDGKLPWSVEETFKEFGDAISKRRKLKSQEWTEALESDAHGIETMPAPDANRLLTHATSPPAFLTEAHSKRLGKLKKQLEARLESLDMEWLIERFRNLSPSAKKKFAKAIAGMLDDD